MDSIAVIYLLVAIVYGVEARAFHRTSDHFVAPASLFGLYVLLSIEKAAHPIDFMIQRLLA